MSNHRATLRQLLHEQPEALKKASEYITRLRSAKIEQTAVAPICALLACEDLALDAVTVTSAQKASYLQANKFSKELASARSLLGQTVKHVSQEKPTEDIFQSLVKAYDFSDRIVPELRRVQRDLVLKVERNSTNHTSLDDKRFPSAIFYWTMTTLKYPMDKSAFCEDEGISEQDLDAIFTTLNKACIEAKLSLEQNSTLRYHAGSVSPSKINRSPSKSSVSPSKAGSISPSKASVSPFKAGFISPSKSGASPSNLAFVTPSKATRAAAGSVLKRKLSDTLGTPEASPSKKPYKPSPLRHEVSAPGPSNHRRSITAEPPSEGAFNREVFPEEDMAVDDALPEAVLLRRKVPNPTRTYVPPPSGYESPDDEDFGISTRPDASGKVRRIRPTFIDKIGPTHEENMRQIEAFRKKKADTLEKYGHLLRDSDSDIGEEEGVTGKQVDKGAEASEEEDEDYEDVYGEGGKGGEDMSEGDDDEDIDENEEDYDE